MMKFTVDRLNDLLTENGLPEYPHEDYYEWNTLLWVKPNMHFALNILDEKRGFNTEGQIGDRIKQHEAREGVTSLITVPYQNIRFYHWLGADAVAA
jgi:hypothetical protein